MIFNNFSINDLKRISPNYSAIDFEKDDYIKLYNLYRSLLTEYIIDTLELKKYDEKILKSNLNFKQTNKEEMDSYQYFSSEELKYLYIRNNIYIEKLDENEMSFLKNVLNSNLYSLNEETKKFIVNTYEKVISECRENDGKESFTFYGPNTTRFMASNKSLIIGMRYDEFAEDGLNDDEWYDRHVSQILDYLPQIFFEIESNSEEKISMPLRVLRYNEYSIIKRKNDKEMEEK